jgi:hypothetical protein
MPSHKWSFVKQSDPIQHCCLLFLSLPCRCVPVPATPISTIIKDYATTAAIIGGGCWALWRWVFEERLRRHRDFPALDGEIRTVETKLDEQNVVVTVNALWRNRGKLPVEIDTG